jgi:hypothetical protein
MNLSAGGETENWKITGEEAIAQILILPAPPYREMLLAATRMPR